MIRPYKDGIYNQEAHLLYLAGTVRQIPDDIISILDSIENLNKALALVPEYRRAQSELAYANVLYVARNPGLSIDDRNKFLDIAKLSALNALEGDGLFDYTSHWSYGLYLHHDTRHVDGFEQGLKAFANARFLFLRNTDFTERSNWFNYEYAEILADSYFDTTMTRIYDIENEYFLVEENLISLLKPNPHHDIHRYVDAPDEVLRNPISKHNEETNILNYSEHLVDNNHGNRPQYLWSSAYVHYRNHVNHDKNSKHELANISLNNARNYIDSFNINELSNRFSIRAAEFTKEAIYTASPDQGDRDIARAINYRNIQNSGELTRNQIDRMKEVFSRNTLTDYEAILEQDYDFYTELVKSELDYYSENATENIKHAKNYWNTTQINAQINNAYDITTNKNLESFIKEFSKNNFNNLEK